MTVGMILMLLHIPRVNEMAARGIYGKGLPTIIMAAVYILLISGNSI